MMKRKERSSDAHGNLVAEVMAKLLELTMMEPDIPERPLYTSMSAGDHYKEQVESAMLEFRARKAELAKEITDLIQRMD